ncbi:hypothetical protein [Paenibacillus tarimensis]|uniref:hypothetical protein n=1 Tax=Paenibacillus tarimensis TaxID=416012 RepID=UPI001F3D2DCC|nr:hypothetical protein [Paenibacillus tarimensis]MCF2944357.1 hypothetical protein [Paenibacillus tarimensis]
MDLFKKISLSLIVVVSLIVASGCAEALKDKTAELITVTEVTDDSIVVVSETFGDGTEIGIPKGISALIQEGNQYFVEYVHDDGKSKRMIKISPFTKTIE